MDITIQQDATDQTKVELAKSHKKNKLVLYVVFILFGWSYGSFGKIGIQAVYYIIPLFAISNIWITQKTNEFDVYSGMAIVSLFLWSLWFLVRLFTLNSDINEYNREIANYFYLTPEEKKEAGIE